MDIMAESENRTLSDKFMLRLPDGMRDRIKAAAEGNNRSMNAEIVATLEEKYPAPAIDLLRAIFFESARIADTLLFEANITDPSSEEGQAIIIQALDMQHRDRAAGNPPHIREDAPRILSQNFIHPGATENPSLSPLASAMQEARTRRVLLQLVAANKDRFPDKSSLTVADALNLVEETLDSTIHDPRHPEYDTKAHARFLDARDFLAERAKTEPDAPALSESTKAEQSAPRSAQAPAAASATDSPAEAKTKTRLPARGTLGAIERSSGTDSSQAKGSNTPRLRVERSIFPKGGGGTISSTVSSKTSGESGVSVTGTKSVTDSSSAIKRVRRIVRPISRKDGE